MDPLRACNGAASRVNRYKYVGNAIYIYIYALLIHTTVYIDVQCFVAYTFSVIEFRWNMIRLLI